MYNEEQWSEITGVEYTSANPVTPPDTLVNGGALTLALNVLRRAGKNEVADELEKTAIRCPVIKPPIDSLLQQHYLNVASQCRATATDRLSHQILVDGGSALLWELLVDASQGLVTAYEIS